MEITQVIVAYRNPFEMWLWESGAIWFIPLFLIIISLVLFFSSITISIISFFSNRNNDPQG